MPRTLPALEKALELSDRASRQGFDWPDLAGVLAKVDEELVQTHDPEREDFLVTVFKSEELGFYSDEFEADDAADEEDDEEER